MMMFKPLPITDFTWLELALVAIVGAICYRYVVRREHDLAARLSASLIFLAILFLTALEATQFMTMDEQGISAWLMNPKSRAIDNLEYGMFKTSVLVSLPPTLLMQALGVPEPFIRMTLKAIWWVMGNAIILALAWQVVRLVVPAEQTRAPLVATVYAALVLLPTTQLAIKTVNYDVLSGHLGALALITLLRALNENTGRLYALALALGLLAGQEKLTASPILVAMIVLTSVRVGWGQATRVGSALVAMRTAAITILAAGLFFLLTISIFVDLSPQVDPVRISRIYRAAFDPFGTWLWPVAGFFLTFGGVMDNRVWIGLIGAAVIVVATGVAALLAPVVVARWQDVAQRRGLAIVSGIMAVIAALFLIGVIGANSINGFWGPYHPSKLEHIARIHDSKGALLQNLAGATLHVDATSVFTHALLMSAYAVAIIVVATPTGVWLLALPGLLRRRFVAEAGGAWLPTALLITLLVAMALPVGAVIAGMPFAHRYFNLNITLFAIVLLLPALVLFARPVTVSGRDIRPVAALAIVGLIIVEALPFRPLFAAYRPFWLSYGDAERAEPGRLNASWMDWGESFMRGGKILERACRAGRLDVAPGDCTKIAIVPVSGGVWLPGPRRIQVAPFDHTKPPVNSPHVYYHFNRLQLIQKFKPAPDLPADFVVRHRGYAMGWVYRGDRLAATGYSF